MLIVIAMKSAKSAAKLPTAHNKSVSFSVGMHMMGRMAMAMTIIHCVGVYESFDMISKHETREGSNSTPPKTRNAVGVSRQDMASENMIVFLHRRRFEIIIFHETMKRHDAIHNDSSVHPCTYSVN